MWCGRIAVLRRTSTFNDFDFLMGVNARPRVIWRFFQTYHAVASVDVTYYFIPLSGRDLNFPVTGQIGMSVSLLTEACARHK